MDRFEKYMKNKFIYAVSRLICSYKDHAVASRSAALAYYMLFALFPLVIFISLIISKIDVDVVQIESMLGELIPQNVAEVIFMLLENTRRLNTGVILSTGIFGAAYAMLRAVANLGKSMDLAYDTPKRRNPLLQFPIYLTMAVLLLIVVVVSLASIVATPKLLTRISKIVFLNSILPKIWPYVRYIVATAMLFGVNCMLYFVVPNRRIRFRQVLPGAATAILVWVPATVGFSFYVENMSKYTLLYGSLGAIIILLLWLYLTGIVLIMGAELNSILMDMSHDKMIGKDKER